LDLCYNRFTQSTELCENNKPQKAKTETVHNEMHRLFPIYGPLFHSHVFSNGNIRLDGYEEEFSQECRAKES